MQILRIILMVCFVFTVYPSIGEAQNGRVGINKGGDEPPASDPLTIETTSQPALHKSDKARSLESEVSRAELPLGMDDTVNRLSGNDSRELAIKGGETLSLDRKGDSWSEEPEKKMSERINPKEGGFQPNTDIKDSLEDDGY